MTTTKLRASRARRWHVLAFFLTALGTAAMGRDVRAADTADEADLQFQLGAERYDAGDYRGALQHFLASNRLVPNKNVMFNIGRSYEQLKQLPDAFRYYQDAIEGEQNPATRKRLEESLARLRPNIALLTVETTPPGATIYLDRKDLGPRGVTPRSLALPPGPHKVIVEMPGYEVAESDKVELKVGAEAKSALTLVPILGNVKVDGTPQAAVRLDSDTGTIACFIPCSLSAPPGRHTLFVTREGWKSMEVPIDVAPNVAVEARAKLDPLSGSVVVNSDQQALVTIDGQPRGFTPAVVSVPVGPHVLRVSTPGFRTVDRNIVVKADESVTLDVDLSGQEEVLGASRAAEAVEDAPASVTIISREELRGMNYPTIAEAIRGVRGVYLSYDDTYTSPGVRGFSRPGDYGNRILVLVDGHATNDNYIWSSYLGFDARADIDDIERIEIIRGAGSVVYGTGAFFGVINLVTRDKSQPTHAEASVSTALGAGRARLTYVWHPIDDGGAWMSIAGAQSNGFERYYPEYVSNPGRPITDWQGNPSNGVARDVDGFRVGTINGKAWYKALSVSWMLNSHYKQSPSAQFGTLFGHPDNHNADTRAYVEAQFEPKISETVESLTRAYFDYYRYDNALPFTPNAIDNTQFGPENDTYTGQWGGLEQRFVVKPVQSLRLTGGATFIQHFMAKQFGEDDANRPGYVGADAGPIIDRNDRFKNIAGYALADLAISQRLKVSAGARVDYFEKLDFDLGASLSPRLAVIVKPYERGNLKIMGGKAFRAPSVYERFYVSATQIAPDTIKPEQVYSGELELTHRFSSAVSGTLATYANYVTDLIELNNVTVNGNTLNQYGNSNAPVRVLGGEAELRREWKQGWMVSASYSFQRASYLRDPNLREVPNSPQHLAAAKGAMPLIGRVLTASTRLSIEGPRYDGKNRNVDIACDPNGATPVACEAQGTTDPGVIWDVVFGGTLERFNATYSVGAYNVMDWAYDTVPSAEYLQRTIRQRPRTVMAQLTVSF